MDLRRKPLAVLLCPFPAVFGEGVVHRWIVKSSEFVHLRVRIRELGGDQFHTLRADHLDGLQRRNAVAHRDDVRPRIPSAA
ncbi:hypothetical protein [Halocatena salina]|uniref:Uncharacterized protein n=1 Tax=Halocatena salina TaxID=2934340 RepID=A0A8U0A5H4_9EURY|nr:hypothetical protein [Halocatena salina]UPM44435.1 hypothetical protein MW046_13390 [Halocatena salina]